MPEGLKLEDPKLQADNVRKAFEQEFERFARFRARVSPACLTLTEAEALQRELQDLRTRAVDKKSELVVLKTLPERRPRRGHPYPITLVRQRKDNGLEMERLESRCERKTVFHARVLNKDSRLIRREAA